MKDMNRKMSGGLGSIKICSLFLSRDGGDRYPHLGIGAAISVIDFRYITMTNNENSKNGE